MSLLFNRIFTAGTQTASKKHAQEPARPML